MDNQHRKIRGYKELSQEEIDLINKIKEAGSQLEDLIGHLRQIPDVDQRWISIGTTDLQRGLMSLTRAVANPDFF